MIKDDMNINVDPSEEVEEGPHFSLDLFDEMVRLTEQYIAEEALSSGTHKIEDLPLKPE